MAAAGPRETRIDLIRGVSLLLIFAAHCNFDFSSAIQQSRGFADASELFVMMAGMSAALAYMPFTAGRAIPTGRILARALRLYGVHLALVLALAALVLLPSPLRPGRFLIEDPGILGAWQVTDLREAPGRFLLDALRLLALPADLDILPLYVVLMAALPLLILGLRRSAPVLFLGSALLWIVAGATHLDFANRTQPSGHWYFDPLTWQFVFVLGLVFGLRIKRGLDPFPYRRALFAIALAVALLSVPGNLLLQFTAAGAALKEEHHLLSAVLVSKTFCGALRLADAIAIVYLVWNLEIVRRAAAHSWLAWVQAAGRHSLPVFSAGLVLSTAIQGLMASPLAVPLVAQLALLVLGCFAQLRIAAWRERRKRALRHGVPAGAPAPAAL